MKSKSTFSFIKILCLPVVFAALSLNLFGQTSHKVLVTNYAFTPSQITITAGDTVIWKSTEGNHNVNGKQTTFPSNPASFGNSLGSNWTYKYVFNSSGTYNYQCDPHIAMGMVGKVVVVAKPDPGILTLTINFLEMNSHQGELFWVAVIDQTTKKEIYRVKTKVTPTFSFIVPGIELGKSYLIDTFADHNNDGVYSTPPADHGYRMTLNNVTGNSVVNFTHNNDIVNVYWKTKLTVRFTEMTSHIGQKLTMFVRKIGGTEYLDTIVVNQIQAAAFDVSSWKIKPGSSYIVDFYADLNKNGIYNPPPTDHSWRILLDKVVSDTIIGFTPNSTFTDLFSVTGTEHTLKGSKNIRLYPNPASRFVELMVSQEEAANIQSLKIYSISGSLIEQKVFQGNTGVIRFDIGRYRNGLYLMEINRGNQKNVIKFVKQ